MQYLSSLVVIQQLTQYRHLLHEVTVPTFIPNDTLIVGGNGRERSPPNTSSLSLDTSVGVTDTEGPSMILLTGPNYSGKSVYLKQVCSYIKQHEI